MNFFWVLQQLKHDGNNDLQLCLVEKIQQLTSQSNKEGYIKHVHDYLIKEGLIPDDVEEKKEVEKSEEQKEKKKRKRNRKKGNNKNGEQGGN